MNGKSKEKTRQRIGSNYESGGSFKFRGIIENIRTHKTDTLDDIVSRNMHRRQSKSNSDSNLTTLNTHRSSISNNLTPYYVDLPETWTPMPSNVNYSLVDVNYLSPEYMQVIRDFKARMNGIKVIYFKVQRVQNRSLYENYVAHQYRLQKKLYNENESILWYGVKNESVKNVCTFGFNNYYCAGLNGHKFGHGIYFSVNTSYAHNYTDVSLDTGVRKIFRARVLIGKPVVGNETHKIPPLKSNGDHYDSTCDKEKSLYVVYEDTQSYPEYLISYKSC